MFSYFLTDPSKFFILFISLLIAIAIHEASHAWMANRRGDPTARLQGRLTLNPLAHLDPLGTLLLLLIGFGWGKPVPVDIYNLDNPRRDSAIISLSGPAANLILALLISLIWRSMLFFIPINSTLSFIFLTLIRLNIMLGLFNLIPLHPLDGEKILIGILSHSKVAEVEEFLSRYSLPIFLFLILPLLRGQSLLNLIFIPLIDSVLNFLIPIGLLQK